jgi:hypothetical protein
MVLNPGSTSGYVNTLNLANYLHAKVPPLSKQLFHQTQTPVTANSGKSFEITKITKVE